MRDSYLGSATVCVKTNMTESIETKITKETNLAELIFRFPQAAEVLLDFGLHCVGCAANGFDTIEAGAKVHGYTDVEVDEIITRVNEVVEHGE